MQKQRLEIAPIGRGYRTFYLWVNLDAYRTPSDLWRDSIGRRWPLSRLS